MKIGISLSGGAVKGVAHLGVLRALEEEGIVPEVYIGTSAGAIAAVLKVSGATDEQSLELSRSSKLTSLIGFNWPKKGILPLSKLKKKLQPLISFERLEELPKKVYINVSDIEYGKTVLFDHGPLLDLISASCAIPMMFEPQQIDDHWYIDGGVLNNMPVGELGSVCDFVIGVNVMHVNYNPLNKMKGVLPVLDRSLDISLYHRTLKNHVECDFVFEPQSLHKFNKFAFDQVDEIYELGYNHAKEYMPDLLASIEHKSKEFISN